MDEQLRKDIDKKLYLNEKCREITVSLDEYRNLVSTVASSTREIEYLNKEVRTLEIQSFELRRTIEKLKGNAEELRRTQKS